MIESRLIDNEKKESLLRKGYEVRIPGGRLDHSRFKELEEVFYLFFV